MQLRKSSPHIKRDRDASWREHLAEEEGARFDRYCGTVGGSMRDHMQGRIFTGETFGPRCGHQVSIRRNLG